MSTKKVLLSIGALVCAAVGFFAAQQIDRVHLDSRLEAERQRGNEQASALRSAAEKWSTALVNTEGASVLRAFVAGIAPAVMAQRKESLEFAAVSLLRIQGVAGIHVLATDGSVLYSSDAKLTTTGKAEYRGAWALQATELVSRPGSRPGVIEFAMPIVQAEKRLAVAWLEFDAARVQSEARPPVLDTTTQSSPGEAESGKDVPAN